MRHSVPPRRGQQHCTGSQKVRGPCLLQSKRHLGSASGPGKRNVVAGAAAPVCACMAHPLGLPRPACITPPPCTPPPPAGDMADACDRPEGLRPNQTSANSCENLRVYGRCKFGDDCYYAHSQEESELFSQWARTQKVG